MKLPATVGIPATLAALCVIMQERERDSTRYCLMGGKTWQISGLLQRMTSRRRKSLWEATIRQGGDAEHPRQATVFSRALRGRGCPVEECIEANHSKPRQFGAT